MLKYYITVCGLLLVAALVDIYVDYAKYPRRRSWRDRRRWWWKSFRRLWFGISFPIRYLLLYPASWLIGTFCWLVTLPAYALLLKDERRGGVL